jgi:FkbM family methyltransferase
MLGSLIPKILKDYLKEKIGVPNMFSSFKHMKKLGFEPRFILDIGAYEGEWSKKMSSIFPAAEIMMVEGQTEKAQILNEICKTTTKFTFETALLGATDDEVKFNKYETASSILKENNITNAVVETRTLKTLDSIVDQKTIEGPVLLKIDTQGYELEILKGAAHFLKKVDVVLLEVSMLNIYIDSPLVDEVIVFMKEKGFYLYDICSIIRRPLDGALYQSDFIFVTKNFLNRDSNKWSA